MKNKIKYHLSSEHDIFLIEKDKDNEEEKKTIVRNQSKAQIFIKISQSNNFKILKF